MKYFTSSKKGMLNYVDDMRFQRCFPNSREFHAFCVADPGQAFLLKRFHDNLLMASSQHYRDCTISGHEKWKMIAKLLITQYNNE